MLDQSIRILYSIVFVVELEDLPDDLRLVYFETKGMQIDSIAVALFMANASVKSIIEDGVEEVLWEMTPQLVFAASQQFQAQQVPIKDIWELFLGKLIVESLGVVWTVVTWYFLCYSSSMLIVYPLYMAGNFSLFWIYLSSFSQSHVVLFYSFAALQGFPQQLCSPDVLRKKH